ncbi:MAG: S-ribosylhomocysteine lyase [Christensenellaceae bacterium]
MEKIESFKIDHEKLLPGLYVSRRDQKQDVVVTTFDIRMTRPNVEPCLDSSAMHTIEHVVATVLRNGDRKSDVVYFGPMGCKTGFYLVMFGDLTVENVLSLVEDAFSCVAKWKGEIPGATKLECGNYLLQNLDVAKFYAKRYLKDLKKYRSFSYKQL